MASTEQAQPMAVTRVSSLRAAASPPKRHSISGNVVFPPSKGSTPSSNRVVQTLAARVSSPGIVGANGSGGGNGAGSNGPGSPVAGGGGSGGGGSLNLSGDIPRLPRVSDTGERIMRGPPSATMLRRSSTMSNSAMARQVMESLPASIPEGPDSPAALKKERNTLRLEKSALLQNKRKLEALIGKMLEQQEAEAGHAGGSGGPPPRPQLLRGSTMRAQLLKALDESTGLEKQLCNGGGPFTGGANGANGTGGVNGAASDSSGSADDPDERVRELTAKLAQLQADHDVAVARLEGELAYRRTQAAASTQHLHKQLAEAEEEIKDARWRLQSEEDRVRVLTGQNEELRGQIASLKEALAAKSQEALDFKDMIGMDKATMATVNEMLREQLREANADRQAKIKAIAELEYALVHRDALLAEASERMNAAAAQAAAAAAGASSAMATANAFSAAQRSATRGRDREKEREREEVGHTTTTAWGARSVSTRPRALSNSDAAAAAAAADGATGGSGSGGSGVSPVGTPTQSAAGGGGGSRPKTAAALSEQNSYGTDGFEADDGEE